MANTYTENLPWGTFDMSARGPDYASGMQGAAIPFFKDGNALLQAYMVPSPEVAADATCLGTFFVSLVPGDTDSSLPTYVFALDAGSIANGDPGATGWYQAGTGPLLLASNRVGDPLTNTELATEFLGDAGSRDYTRSPLLLEVSIDYKQERAVVAVDRHDLAPVGADSSSVVSLPGIGGATGRDGGSTYYVSFCKYDPADGTSAQGGVTYRAIDAQMACCLGQGDSETLGFAALEQPQSSTCNQVVGGGANDPETGTTGYCGGNPDDTEMCACVNSAVGNWELASCFDPLCIAGAGKAYVLGDAPECEAKCATFVEQIAGGNLTTGDITNLNACSDPFENLAARALLFWNGVKQGQTKDVLWFFAIVGGLLLIVGTLVALLLLRHEHKAKAAAWLRGKLGGVGTPPGKTGT